MAYQAVQLNLFPQDDYPAPLRVPAIGRYFGGKALPHVREWIGLSLPTCYRYVECCGGLWSIGLWRWRSPKEIYNDINLETVALIETIQNNPAPLIEKLNRTEWSRELYYEAVKPSPTPSAYNAMVRCCLGYVGGGVTGGGTSSCRVERYRAPKGTSTARINEVQSRNFDYLFKVSERLQGVSLLTIDAIACILMYDSEDTLFYIDPPYSHGQRTQTRYVFDANDAYHSRLLSVLLQCKGKIVVSNYSDPLYEAALAGWRRKELVVQSSGRTERTEVLWSNF